MCVGIHGRKGSFRRGSWKVEVLIEDLVVQIRRTLPVNSNDIRVSLAGLATG